MSASSFISSSNVALAMLDNGWVIGSRWVLCCALVALFFSICAGLLAWKWKRIRKPFRALSIFVLFILLMRCVLFYNPIAWEYWERTRTPDKVGYINHTFMLMQQKRHYANDLKPKKTETLAFGTSQIWAVFGAAANASDQLNAFSIPGLGPWGYDLYRDIVKGYNPRTIILYVSEFDLAHAPIWEALEFAPLSREYRQKLKHEESIGRLQGTASKMYRHLQILNLFPEVKYSFLFRMPLEKEMGKDAVLSRPSELDIRFEEYMNEISEPQQEPDAEQIRQKEMQNHFRNLAEKLKRQNMEPNLLHLESFINFCVGEGIRVVIVEGQYHPDAPIENRVQMHDLATERLAKIAREKKSVIFIPSAEIMPFTDKDYLDGYHVTQESGKIFCEILANRLAHLEPGKW